MKTHLRIVRVSTQFLVALCKPGAHAAEVTANALPEDARVHHVAVDPYRQDTVMIVVESAAFDGIPLGQTLPEHPEIQFTRREVKP